jgi:hypothetical protein
MSVDAGAPSEVLVGDAADRGTTDSDSGAPRRGFLALLCLIEVVWIGSLIYATVRTVDFVRELL